MVTLYTMFITQRINQRSNNTSKIMLSVNQTAKARFYSIPMHVHILTKFINRKKLQIQDLDFYDQREIFKHFDNLAIIKFRFNRRLFLIFYQISRKIQVCISDVKNKTFTDPQGKQIADFICCEVNTFQFMCRPY